MNPLQQLSELGQSVWLDALRRSYLGEDGYLARLIDAGELEGLTSNPTIFQKALAGDDSYDEDIAARRGQDPREAFWDIVKADVGAAADLFLPLYRSSRGRAGYVSIELDPSKAFDTEETVSDGLVLWRELDRPNLMVKVPGTEAGLPAVTRLLAEGVNVNVTLLFSVPRYEEVVAAHKEGIRRLVESGGDMSPSASVASFFVSRVDSKVDALLPQGHDLRGKAGVANARVAYGSFRRLYDDDAEWAELADAGARVQRPLWASTSVKTEEYSDTLYVDELAGPDTVNTMPEETLDAARERAEVADRLGGRQDEARQVLDRLAAEGVDLDQVTKELETEGVEKFVSSFEEAVDTLAQRLG